MPIPKIFNNNNDVIEYLKTKKNYDANVSLINTTRLKTINENGMIEPIKRWVIDACWN
jgi:hypothetical protein